MLGAECATSCWGAGVSGSDAVEQGSATCSSTVTQTWLFGDDAVELEVQASAGINSTFCCSRENVSSDCMALLKVPWCWTSWRTHFERPERKQVEFTVDNYCHLLVTLSMTQTHSDRQTITRDVFIWVVFVAVIDQDQRAPVVPVADAPVTRWFGGLKS